MKLFFKSWKELYFETSSYHPITKSSYVAKLLERIWKNEISHYMNCNGMDDPFQEVFRKRKPTARYNTDLFNIIQLAWASSQIPVVLSVELEIAFDSVWFDGIMWKMYSLKDSRHQSTKPKQKISAKHRTNLQSTPLSAG